MLHSLKDFLFTVEYGALISIFVFLFLSISSISTVLMFSQDRTKPKISNMADFRTYLIVDFVGGFIRGFQKS